MKNLVSLNHLLKRLHLPWASIRALTRRGSGGSFHACVHRQLVSRAKQLSAFSWLDSPLESDLSRGFGDNVKGEVAPRWGPWAHPMSCLKQQKTAYQSACLLVTQVLLLHRVQISSHLSKSVK